MARIDPSELGFDETISALDVLPISPNDDNELSSPVRALRANSSGTIRVTTYRGNVRTLNFLAGEQRNVVVTKVWQTGTTAGGIEGMT